MEDLEKHLQFIYCNYLREQLNSCDILGQLRNPAGYRICQDELARLGGAGVGKGSMALGIKKFPKLGPEHLQAPRP